MAGLVTGATNVVKGVMKNPEFIHELLKYCSKVITVFGNAMAEAGADALIMLEQMCIRDRTCIDNIFFHC